MTYLPRIRLPTRFQKKKHEENGILKNKGNIGTFDETLMMIYDILRNKHYAMIILFDKVV